MKYACISACCVVFMIMAGTSSAQEDADSSRQARDLYQQGIENFEKGRHAEAADAFREAHKLRPSWKIFYNIGQAEAAAGRYGLALEYFQKYLVKGRDEIPLERKEYVLAEMRRLKDLVGELKVQAPKDSVVYVDGVNRGTAPLLKPVLVVAGEEHEVVVTLEENEILQKKFSVWGGSRFEVKAVRPEEKPAPVEEVQPEEPEPVPEPEPEEEPGDEGLDQTYFWIGLGASAAFGAVTIGMIVLSDQKLDDVRSDPDSDSLRDETKICQNTGIAFMALTGAALVTTGILAAFTDFSFEDEGTDVALAPWASDNAGGMGVMGRF